MIYFILVLLIIAVIVIIYTKRKSVKKIPQGLQIFDSNGQTVVDLSARLTHIIDVVDISSFNGQNGIINVNATQGKEIFAYTVGSVWAACKVEGNTISYAFNRSYEVQHNNSSPKVYLIYGEY